MGCCFSFNDKMNVVEWMQAIQKNHLYREVRL